MPAMTIEAAANELAKTFELTWNDRDGLAYGTAYWPDAELVDPLGQIWDGRDAIIQMHIDLWHGPFSNTTVRTRVRRVRMIAPTVAVVDLDILGKDFPGPPGQSGDIAARLKHVVELRDSEWKIGASQNTFVTTLPGN